MKTVITVLFAVLSLNSSAQGLSGKVLDEKKEPIINAIVQVFSSNGVLMGGNVTDYDGNFLVKPLDPGYYTVAVRFNGYDTSTVTRVIVSQATNTSQNFALYKFVDHPKNVVTEYKNRLINQDDSLAVITSGIPDPAPLVDESGIFLVAYPGLYQSKRGSDVRIQNGRGSGTQYIIDGCMVQPLILAAVLPETNTHLHSRLANPSIHRFSRAELTAMPVTDLRDAISLLPGVYQARRGDDLSIFGARISGTQYAIDGIRQ